MQNYIFISMVQNYIFISMVQNYIFILMVLVVLVMSYLLNRWLNTRNYTVLFYDTNSSDFDIKTFKYLLKQIIGDPLPPPLGFFLENWSELPEMTRTFIRILFIQVHQNFPLRWMGGRANAPSVHTQGAMTPIGVSWSYLRLISPNIELTFQC